MVGFCVSCRWLQGGDQESEYQCRSLAPRAEKQWPPVHGTTAPPSQGYAQVLYEAASEGMARAGPENGREQ